MTGKCLCGNIEFEFDPMKRVAMNCHCSRCRVSHGAAFATQLFSSKSSLVFKKGREHIKEFESTGGIRAFCSNCGSRLMNYAKSGNGYLSVALSCVQEPHNIKPIANAFVGSKAPWYTPAENIPQFEAMPAGVADYL
ncbi:MAG: GFA family protein [Cellvibrio sp.]